MRNLKNYSFEIKTVKMLDNNDSNCILSKYEFLAKSLEDAENYKAFLIENFRNNKPFKSEIPWIYTKLREIDGSFLS